MFDAEAALTALGVPTVLDELIATRQIPSVVVLLVGNANRGKELSADPTFVDFVALDLVPWACRSYHTTNEPRLTVVAGVSLGGLAAALSAARHPAVYGNVLSQSGSYWWGGVATAVLLQAGLPVVAQRDFRALASLRARLDPTFTPPEGLFDHHEHPWVLEHLPGPHPRV